MAKLIGGFVAILLGFSLMPVISNQVNKALATPEFASSLAGSTSWGATALKLVPWLFALGLLLTGIAVAWGTLKSSGLTGDRDGLEGKTIRYLTAAGQVNDVYGTMDEAQAMAEVRRETEPPKYYKESQLRQIEDKYKPMFNEGVSKFD